MQFHDIDDIHDDADVSYREETPLKRYLLMFVYPCNATLYNRLQTIIGLILINIFSHVFIIRGIFIPTQFDNGPS